MSVSDENGKPEVSSTEILDRLAKLEGENEKLMSTNQRLLDENYQKSQKLKTVKTQVNEFEELRKAKLSAEERLAEDQEEMQRLKSELETEKDRIFNFNAERMIREVAPDARDAEELIELKSVRQFLEIDEDNNSVTRESAEKAVNYLRENKNYYFKKPEKMPKMGSGGKPEPVEGYKSAVEKIETVGWKNSSTSDLKAALRETYKSKRRN